MKSKKSNKFKKTKLPKLTRRVLTYLFEGTKSPKAKRRVFILRAYAHSFLRRGIKLNLFQEVDFKPKSSEMAALVLVCAVVFGISFFGSGKLLYDFGQKKERNALNSSPEMQIIKNAIAADNQTDENTSGTEGNASLEENIGPELMLEEANLAKDKADKEARAKIIARQRAAEIALINSAPVLAGSTNKLPSGLRVCPVKSEHPQRGGRTHVDEDCCADYNEYPNPRCYYPPNEMAILKKR